jgi:rRNA-processing protein FCF1
MSIIKKVIIDTNFLLIPEQFHIDIFEEIKTLMNHNYEMYIIDKTLDELDKLKMKGKTRDKIAATIGKELVRLRKVKIIPTDSPKIVDDLILEHIDADTFVCTNDKELKRLVVKEGGKIIQLAQKKYLKITT